MRPGLQPGQEATAAAMKEDLLTKTHLHHQQKQNGHQINKPSSPYPLPSPASYPAIRPLPRLMTYLLLLISFTYLIYTLKLLSTGQPCHNATNAATAADHHHRRQENLTITFPTTARIGAILRNSTASGDRVDGGEEPTSLRHVIFAISGSSKLWDTRKEYIRLWWRPQSMRGVVWLDKPVSSASDDDAAAASLPQVHISGDTASFPYTNTKGDRSAIRLALIASDTLRLGLHHRSPPARWLVLSDDDTVFLPDNLVGVLRRFDHRQPHYLGSVSESHLQNIYFSTSMAYGGGGIALSLPLATAVARIQRRCIRRYPGLYGSDDRLQACMAELGVPLTRHPGFHQFDVYGNLFGLLAAHPVAPLLSLHHLDVADPIFPGATRLESLSRFTSGPARVDPAAAMQQSICYESGRKWTVSVSWGFAVQIIRGTVSPREMEMPARTFLNWYTREDYKAYSFNTRPVARSPCLRPFVYYFQSVESSDSATTSRYGPRRVLEGGGKGAECRRRKGVDPLEIDGVVVVKRLDPELWDRAPRRNCCRVLRYEGGGENKTMVVDVGVCKDGEISEMLQ